MANRYDIVRIDFQASARGANAAIESLRQEAEKSNAELTKIRGNIDNALKAGAPDEVIAGMRAEAKAEERRYKQLTQAQNELIKGMRVLDQGVKMFNDGSLSQMNAAFQKAVNSAAKLAQSKMDAGTQSWREMGAIMQETEQNYARMQRDTEQLIQVIQNGGTVFRSTLEAEKKGIQELMGLVPYMGSEYQKLEGQLQVVTTKLDQMATAERQMKGEIVTANDARRVAYQLTEEGAAAAKREAEAAEQTIAASKERISVLEQERKTREDAARATAETVAKRNEDLAMQRDVIESIEKEIGKEDRKSKKKREAADAAKATAEESVKAVETEKAALEGLQTTTKAAEDEVKRLEGELSKLGTQKVQPKVEADTSEAKKELSKLQQQLQRIQGLKAEAQSKLDTIKTSVGELKNPVNHDDVKKALEEDRAAQQETIAKLDAKWDEYWKKQEANAKKFAEVLKKSVDDIDYKDFYEHVSGPNSELAKSWYRTQRRESYGIDYWGNDSENYRELTLLRAGKRVGNLTAETQEELKVLEGLKRKYEEYEKAKNKAREATPKYDSAYEKIDKALNERLQEEAKLEVYYEEEIKLKEQIAAKEKEITEARKQSTQPIQQQDAEIKNLTNDIKNLDGMISELKKQRDALNTSQQKSTAGMEGEAKSAQDLVKEMKRLNDEIDKQKGKLLKPEKEYQKSLQLATAAKKPEDRDRLIAEAEQKLNEKTATTKAKIQELERQLDKAREAYKALTKEEGAATDAADDETAAVQKLIQARDKLVALNEKSTFHESVSGERTITNPREAENFLLQQMAKFDSGRVGKTQASVSKTNFEALRKAFGERYGMEKAEAEKWLKELAKPHGGIFTKGGQAGDGSYFFNIDPAQRVTYNKEKLQASKELGRTSIITDPTEAEKAYQAALKQVGATEQQAAAMGKLSGETQKQAQATKEQTQATQKQNEADKDKAALDATIADLESRKQQAQEKLTQLQQQSAKAAAEQAEADKKETELKQQLAGAQQKLTEAQKAEEEQQKKIADVTDKANSYKEKSARLESELANASAEKTAKLEEEKKKLGELEAATEKDIELNNKRQQELQETNDKIAEEGNIIREAQTKRAQAQTNNIKATEDAIRKLREENAAIDVNSKEWSDNAREIQHLEEALGKMKNQAALQMMTERMERVPQLSTAALTETKRFWEGMVAGAERGSKELAEYEANLKTITEEEARRNKQSLKDTSRKLLGNLGGYSVEEIREAIDAATKLQRSYDSTSPAAQRLSKAIVDAEEHLKKYGVEAERAARREAQAVADAAARRREQDALMRQQLQQGTGLSESALKAQEQYWRRLIDDPKTAAESIKGYQHELQRTIELQRQQAEATRNERAARLNGDLGNLSEAEIREAIEAGKQLAQSYKSTSTEAQEMAQKIVAAEEHIKQYGLEAQRAAQKQAAIDTQMRERMNNLTTLSSSALTETKKYWEDMMRTQGLAEQKLSSYRIQLEKLIAEENRRKEVQAERVIGDMGNFSDNEIKQAVQAFEQLRDVQKHGSDEWNYYNQRVQEGKKYLDEWAKVDSVIKFEEQMSKLPQLSDSALQETKKFWETMVAGADKGSSELREYEAHLEKVKQEESERRQLTLEQQAQRITNRPMFFSMSEKEIRQAIEATKELQQTVKMGDDEYDQYTQAIVRAEEHLKKYGLEAERTAAKLKETNAYYESQLNSGQISESALKAQESYWKRLIDDPKTASESLAHYQRNLDEVHRLQQKMADETGQDALAFFEKGRDKNASKNEVEEQLKNLKAFRDSLPRGQYQDTIAKIDEYIHRAGDSAKAASVQMMSLKDALRIGSAAGGANFKGTVEQLTQAKKTLEELQQKAVKGGYAWRRMQEGIDNINLELRRTSFISKEVQAILDAPKGKSFNELKQAIEQGRAALQNMRRTTEEERKAFDELAKKVKEADVQMKALGSSSKATASSFDKAWSRLKTYIGLYVSAAVAMQKLTGTMGDLMELSDKMGEVRKTTNFSADAVGHLTGELKKLDTRTSITGLLDLSVAAGQLGLKTQEDVQGFTEAANKLMVALPEMGREGATEMLKVALATGEIDKIRKQMEEGIIDGSSATAVAMEKVGSTIDRLRATSASTAPAITDFVKRVGAVGAQSGITIDQVAALGSTVDALGMRVEMSATALSRMIPAIRNNAFNIAQVIGVTPDTIRNLFDTGRGMEVILMILQHIKDAGMDADSIEGMLGMGNMKEIMKELNQQGARAGIVFGGLSQNVDELRRQLGVAATAYEENIAIQQEYDKMNETTAAKWARLKNQVEEMFVGDTAQRFLGSIIDGLRHIVDFISGNVNPVLRTISETLKVIAVYWAAFRLGLGEGLMKLFSGFKTMGGGLKALITNTKEYIVLSKALRNAKLAEAAATTAAEKATAAQSVTTIRAKMATLGLNKAMKANVFMAVAAAVLYLTVKVYDFIKSCSVAGKAVADMEMEIRKQQKAVNDLFYTTQKTNSALSESKTRYEELKKAGKDTTEAENQLKKANADHASSIREINSKYGEYLGYMLSETASAEQLARARELINAKLRETITLKQREAALGNVEQEYGGEANKRIAKLDDTVRAWFKDEQQAAKIYTQIVSAVQRFSKDAQGLRTYIDTKILPKGGLGRRRSGTTLSILDVAEDYRQQIEQMQKREEAVNKRFDAQDTENRKSTREATVRTLNQTLADWRKLLGEYQKAEGEEKEKLAAEVYKQQRAYANLLATNADYLENDNRKAIFEKNVKNMATYEKGLRKVAGEAIRTIDAMERAESKITGTDYTKDGESANNPFGSPQGADSLNYADMNPKQLVARRHQMEQFVNAIQTDTDIQSVLSEDKALKAAIEKGMSSDMRTVIEWYNAERLKIQEELRSRHLTNEGHWLDPKKDRSGKSRTPVSDGALAELERYYAWRKEMIEQARIEEGLTEEEFNRRIDVMEQEHMKKRSDLRVSFTTRDKKFIEDFHKWWASVEELEEVDWKLISDEWRAILLDAKNGDKQVKMNNMKAQKDLAAMERIVVKHLNAIDDILSKERPYDGITRNLQDNLTKMGILFADFDAEIRERIAKGETDVSIDAADEVLNRTKRLAFLLKEAEHAYNITITDLLNTMRQEGFDAWADEIQKDDKLQQALMAQLRTAYDAVQDAIKKEATQIKKQAEIQWNDTTIGKNGQQSQKQYFESMLAQLGLQEDAIKRANSLIGAGNASENVALRLAVKQMEIRLNMQAQYYALMRKIGQERANQLLLTAQEARIESERLKTEAARLRAEGKTDAAEQKERDAAKKDAEAIQATADRTHVLRSLDLATTEEQKKLDEQRVAIANQLEEIQNNTYKSLKEWGDLLASSLQSLFEASHAGDKEYYNELAKLELTGKGGPGAGTYIVIENEGTSDAEAHYEYLDEREALDRQREIERQNAQAEAWRKVMDDINMKMSETITDQMNAMLQNASVDANTDAVGANTEAIIRATEALNSQGVGSGVKLDASMTGIEPSSTPEFDETNPDTWPRAMRKRAGLQVDSDPYNNTGGEAENTSVFLNPAGAGNFDSWYEQAAGAAELSAQRQIDASNNVAYAMEQNFHKQVDAATDANRKTQTSTQSMFAKMTQALNLYGVAYQAMSNDNLSTEQKFQMIALQAAGSAAMAALTTNLSESQGSALASMPGVLGKIMEELGPIAGPIAYAAFTALIGGLMGMAVSKVTKAKSQIASVTGASSVGAGRLSTGMLTYAEGNVNEFTDPSTLTPGRQYNVDAADGKTYRARYMGRRARTHITNGPEFHLSGEKGREMIIDADTTRQITLNERDIWHTIQTLSAGRRMPRRRLTGRGMPAFADGNVEDFEEMMSGYDVAANGTGGMSAEQSATLQASIDRQSDLLERALTEGIRGVFAVNGPDGLVNTYDKGKRQALRHGQQYP